MGSKGFGLDSHIRLRGSQNRLRGSQQGVELGSHNRLRGSQDKPLARFSYAACAVLKSHMPLARFSMCRLRGSHLPLARFSTAWRAGHGPRVARARAASSDLGYGSEKRAVVRAIGQPILCARCSGPARASRLATHAMAVHTLFYFFSSFIGNRVNAPIAMMAELLDDGGAA